MDKASYFIKIVERNLRGQGACFIFPTAECTFRSGEHKQETLSLLIQDEFL